MRGSRKLALLRSTSSRSPARGEARGEGEVVRGSREEVTTARRGARGMVGGERMVRWEQVRAVVWSTLQRSTVEFIAFPVIKKR